VSIFGLLQRKVNAPDRICHEKLRATLTDEFELQYCIGIPHRHIRHFSSVCVDDATTINNAIVLPCIDRPQYDNESHPNFDTKATLKDATASARRSIRRTTIVHRTMMIPTNGPAAKKEEAIMFEFSDQARRHAKIVMIGLTGLGVTLTSAFAANSVCDGVKVEVTQARKSEYAPLVASAIKSKVKPAQVKFSAIMESGAWSAAYVSTPVSDDGVMFFQTVNGKKQFRDVWGGYAQPSEKPELVSWAKKLGAPQDLARCFAQTVTE
jgi:hypothetical protein